MYNVGDARLESVAATPPCWKLARLHGVPDLPRRVIAEARGGFYLRVLVPGVLESATSVRLIRRPYPRLDVATAGRALYGGGSRVDAATAHALVECAALPRALRAAAARRFLTLRDSP